MIRKVLGNFKQSLFSNFAYLRQRVYLTSLRKKKDENKEKKGKNAERTICLQPNLRKHKSIREDWRSCFHDTLWYTLMKKFLADFFFLFFFFIVIEGLAINLAEITYATERFFHCYFSTFPKYYANNEKHEKYLEISVASRTNNGVNFCNWPILKTLVEVANEDQNHKNILQKSFLSLRKEYFCFS